MLAGVFLFTLPILTLAQNVTVTTQDPRMHFDGPWIVQDSGGHEFTTTIGSSVAVTFPGNWPVRLMFSSKYWQ